MPQPVKRPAAPATRRAAPAPAPTPRRAPAGPPISQEIAAAINAAQGNYAKAAPKGASYIEDGDYQGEIVSAQLAVSQQSRNLMAKYQIRVLSEGAADAVIWKNSMLASEDNIGYFKGELERLGIQPPKSMREVPALLAKMAGLVVDFRAKTSADGQFQNYNFLGLSEEAAPEGDDPNAPVDGEPLPEGEEIIEEGADPNAPMEGEELPAEEGEIIEDPNAGLEEIIEEPEAAPAPAPRRAPAPAVRKAPVPAGVTRFPVRRPAPRQ